MNKLAVLASIAIASLASCATPPPDVSVSENEIIHCGASGGSGFCCVRGSTFCCEWNNGHMDCSSTLADGSTDELPDTLSPPPLDVCESFVNFDPGVDESCSSLINCTTRGDQGICCLSTSVNYCCMWSGSSHVCVGG